MPGIGMRGIGMPGIGRMPGMGRPGAASIGRAGAMGMPGMGMPGAASIGRAGAMGMPGTGMRGAPGMGKRGTPGILGICTAGMPGRGKGRGGCSISPRRHRAAAAGCLFGQLECWCHSISPRRNHRSHASSRSSSRCIWSRRCATLRRYHHLAVFSTSAPFS